MLDIKFIRENKDLVAQAAKKKRVVFDIGELLAADDKRKTLLSSAEKKRAAHLFQALRHLFRCKVDLDPHRLQHIGASGALGDAAIPMLHHRNTHRRKDEHQPRGNIEKIQSAAAGSAIASGAGHQAGVGGGIGMPSSSI